MDLHKKLHHLRSPQGTKESPAQSCLDLYLENNDIENGIDNCYVLMELVSSHTFQTTTGLIQMAGASVML